MKTKSKQSKIKKNKSYKNKIKNLNNSSPYSWKNLEKNKCSFVNVNKSLTKNDKKLKKIALEEAIIWPTQTEDVDEGVPLEYVINTGKGKNKLNRLLDITNVRLNEMKKNNVIYQIISPTASGLQNLKYRSIKDQHHKAIYINNYMYKKIVNHQDRFKAFCTLPMRSPDLSAKELYRCVKKLGMVGALVNGMDMIYKTPIASTIPNRQSLFYDSKDYDILWAMFEKLDVPLYIHPTVYNTTFSEFPDHDLLTLYTKFPQLPGSAWGFSIHLAEQIIRLILSGVFDRFPKLKLILGHMGEVLPWWAERFDHRLCIYKMELKEITKKQFKDNYLPEFAIPKLSIMEYLRRNIYITTSGWFSNDALDYVIKKMGIDRVMFSIDYPYEKQSIACDWMDNVPLSFEDKEKIAYKNAAKLLKIKIDD